MPYMIKNKCIYKKNKDVSIGKKVGCTDGDIKKYLKALIINVKESMGNEMNLKDIIKKYTGDLGNISYIKQYTYNYKGVHKIIIYSIDDDYKYYINDGSDAIGHDKMAYPNEKVALSKAKEYLHDILKENKIKKESNLISIIKRLIKEELDQKTTRDIVEPYFKNPYGIGANNSVLKDKCLELQFEDSYSRQQTIQKLKNMGIKTKSLTTNTLPTAYKYRYILTIWF